MMDIILGVKTMDANMVVVAAYWYYYLPHTVLYVKILA